MLCSLGGAVLQGTVAHAMFGRDMAAVTVGYATLARRSRRAGNGRVGYVRSKEP